MINSGYEVRYSGHIKVEHSHAEAGRKSWFRYYYDTRNQFLLSMRNLPFIDAFFFLFKGCCCTFFYSVRDGYLKYWCSGMLDGIKGVHRNYCDRKVLSSNAIMVIRKMKRESPSFFYMIKKRIFRNSMRL